MHFSQIFIQNLLIKFELICHYLVILWCSQTFSTESEFPEIHKRPVLKDDLLCRTTSKFPKVKKQKTRQIVLPTKAVTSTSGRCKFCDRKKNRKTKSQCSNCHKYICLEHTKRLCPDCDSVVEDYESDE